MTSFAHLHACLHAPLFAHPLIPCCMQQEACMQHQGMGARRRPADAVEQAGDASTAKAGCTGSADPEITTIGVDA
jgi:hypothetical protein